ncbi:hypothetical protein IC575_003556 [Cucumis melo]
MDGAKSGVLVRASRPILLPDIIERSSSETRARKASFHFVPLIHFLLLSSKGDFSYFSSLCDQGLNSKMRCSRHPHLEIRVSVFRLVAFLIHPSLSGTCVRVVLPEIELEALTLPTS